jgi:hypothetical protein
MSGFHTPRELRYRIELENQLKSILTSVIEEYIEADTNSEESREASDESVRRLNLVTEFVKDHLQEKYTGNIYNDILYLTNPKNLEIVIEKLIEIHENRPEDVFLTLQEISRKSGSLESSILDEISGEGSRFVRQSFFDAFQSPSTSGSLHRDFLTSSSPGVNNISRLGAPNLSLDNESVINFYKQKVEGTYSPGLLTGAEVGRAMLGLVTSSKKSLTFGFFQFEQGIIADAARRMQELGTPVNLMLSPASKPGTTESQEVGYLNAITARAFRQGTVSYDPQVVAYLRNRNVDSLTRQNYATAGYAHYKFLGSNLRGSLEERAFMIGSFNITRGALGEILTPSGQLSTANPHNLELGDLITYDLVRKYGMKQEAFERMTNEAAQYEEWLFNRHSRSRHSPAGQNPAYILSGQQTYQRIKQVMEGSGNVNAFFALNVITDEGMFNLENGQGFYDVLLNKLQSSDSKITIFVSRGFQGIRRTNMESSDPIETQTFQRLMQLQDQFKGRFEVREHQDLIHAKAGFIFDQSNNTVHKILGTANVSKEGFGGQSQDVGKYESSSDYEDDSHFRRQIENVLVGLQTRSTSTDNRFSKVKSLLPASAASSESLMRELRMRLDPELLQRVHIKDRFVMDSTGKKVILATTVSIDLPVMVNGQEVIVKNALSLDVREYNNDPSRLYIKELGGKIIDPVIAYAQHANVDLNSLDTGRGRLVAQEFSSSAVVMSVLSNILRDAKSGNNSISVQAESLNLKDFESYVRKTFKERAIDLAKNFEGKPLGQAAAGREFKRLILGTEVVGRSLTELQRFVQPGEIASISEQSRLLGIQSEPGTLSASVLDVSSYPLLGPESIEKSFSLNELGDPEEDEMGVQRRRYAPGNAPSHVVRMINGNASIEPLKFTVNADSLRFDGPSNIFLAEAFNHPGAFSYDRNTGIVYRQLAAVKLQQDPQRFKNIMGADTGRFVLSGQSSITLREARQRVKGKSVEKHQEKTGAVSNFVIVGGLAETTLANSDVFRGAFVEKPVNLDSTIFNTKIIVSANELGSSLFLNERIRRDIHGNWVIYNGNEYVPLDANRAPGIPLLSFGPEQQNIRGVAYVEDGQRKNTLIQNPAYGMLGHSLDVMDIQSSKLDNGNIEVNFKMRYLYPFGSSLRGYASGLKKVYTLVGGGLFQTFAEALNKSVESRGGEELVYGDGTDQRLSLGTYSQFHSEIVGMLTGNPNMPEEQRASLSGQMIHYMASGSTLKTGLVMLETAASRLLSDNFYSLMVGMTQDEARFQAFRQMIEDFSRQAKGSTQNARTILDTIADLMHGRTLGQDSNILEQVSSREGLRRGIEGVRSKLRSGQTFEEISTPEEKAVLSLASVVHIMQSLSAGALAKDSLAAASREISGPTKVLNGLEVQREFDFTLPIFGQTTENVSIKTGSASNRQGSLMPGSQHGLQTQTVANALSRGTDVENKQRLVSEGFYLSTGAVAIRPVLSPGTGGFVIPGSQFVSNMQVTYQSVRPELTPNPIVPAFNFEPFAYAFMGMSTGVRLDPTVGEMSDEERLLKIREISGRLSIDRNLNDEERLQLENEAMRYVVEFNRNKKAIERMGPAAQGFEDSQKVANPDVLIWELMRKHRTASPTIEIDTYSFTEIRPGVFSAGRTGSEIYSLLSPEFLMSIQGQFGSHSSDLLRLQTEVLKSMYTLRKFGLEWVANEQEDGTSILKKETVNEYRKYLRNLDEIKRMLSEVLTTDVQKLATSMGGASAVVSNFLPIFHHLVIGEGENRTTFENTLLLGDDLYNSVLGKVTEARLSLETSLKDLILTSNVDESVKENIRKYIEDNEKFAQGPLKFEPWLVDRARGFGTDSATGYSRTADDQPVNSSVADILLDFERVGEDYGVRLQYAYTKAREASNQALVQRFFRVTAGIDLGLNEDQDLMSADDRMTERRVSSALSGSGLRRGKYRVLSERDRVANLISRTRRSERRIETLHQSLSVVGNLSRQEISSIQGVFSELREQRERLRELGVDVTSLTQSELNTLSQGPRVRGTENNMRSLVEVSFNLDRSLSELLSIVDPSGPNLSETRERISEINRNSLNPLRNELRQLNLEITALERSRSSQSAEQRRQTDTIAHNLRERRDQLTQRISQFTEEIDNLNVGKRFNVFIQERTARLREQTDRFTRSENINSVELENWRQTFDVIQNATERMENIGRLRATRGRLVRTIESVMTRHPDLFEDFSGDRRESLEQELRDTEDSLRGLTSQLEESRAQSRTIGFSRIELREQLLIKRQLRRLQHSSSALMDRLSSARATYESNEAALSEERNSIDDIFDQILRITDNENISGYREARERVDGLRSELDDIQRTINAYQRSGLVGNDIDSKSENLGFLVILESEKSRLQGEIRSLDPRARINDYLESSRAYQQELRSRLSSLPNQQTAEREETLSEIARIENEQNQVNSLLQDIRSRKDQLNTLVQTSATAQNEVESLQERIQSQQDAMSSRRDRLREIAGSDRRQSLTFHRRITARAQTLRQVDQLRQRRASLEDNIRNLNEYGSSGQPPNLENMGAFGQTRVDLLTLQIHFLQDKRLNSPGLDARSKSLIDNAINLSNMEIALLSNSYSETQIRDAITYIKSQMSTNNASDMRKYSKLLQLAQYRLQTANLQPNNPTVITQRSAQDVMYALSAAGYDVLKDVSGTSGKTSLMSPDQTIAYVAKMQNLLNIEHVVGKLQEARRSRQTRPAIAISRAGTPIQEDGGIKSSLVASVREGNYGIVQQGGTIQVDAYAARRSAFMSAFGLAEHLGDQDGDMILKKLIERYTFLEELRRATGAGGLAAVERSAQENMMRLRAQGATEEEINQWQRYISTATDPFTDRRLSLEEEHLNLRNQVQNRAKELMSAHIESYLSLPRGSVSRLAQALYGDAYTSETSLQLDYRVASNLNTFARDMQNKLTEELILRLNNSDSLSLGEVHNGQTNWDALINNPVVKNDILQKAWKRSDSRTLLEDKGLEDLQSLFRTVAGGELHIDNMLRYAAQTAFASTKLIGTFSNLQNLRNTLLISSRLRLTTEYQDIVARLQREGVPQWEIDAQLNLDLQEKALQIARQNDIIRAASGFDGMLQQQTREAIKPKGFSLPNQQTSLLQELYDENIFARVIDATTALTTGSSMFSHVNYQFNSDAGREELSRFNVNNLIETVFDQATGSYVARLNQSEADRIRSSRSSSFIMTEIIDPIIEAARQKAHTDLQIMLKGAKSEHDRQRLADELSNLELSTRSSALMYIYTLFQQRSVTDQFQSFTNNLKALSRSNGDYSGTDQNVADLMQGDRFTQLVFLQESLRGSHLDTPQKLHLVLRSVYDAYAQNGDLETLRTDMRIIDPKGLMLNTLITALDMQAEDERIRQNPMLRSLVDPENLGIVSAMLVSPNAPDAAQRTTALDRIEFALHHGLTEPVIDLERSINENELSFGVNPNSGVGPLRPRNVGPMTRAQELREQADRMIQESIATERELEERQQILAQSVFEQIRQNESSFTQGVNPPGSSQNVVNPPQEQQQQEGIFRRFLNGLDNWMGGFLGGATILGSLGAGSAEAATVTSATDAFSSYIASNITGFDPIISLGNLFAHKASQMAAAPEFYAAAATLSATVIASNLANKYAEKLHERSIVKNTAYAEHNVNNSANVLSTVFSAVAAYGINAIKQEYMKREMVTPVSYLSTRIQDEIQLKESIIMASQQDMEELGANYGNTIEYAFDENGDPIPFNSREVDPFNPAEDAKHAGRGDITISDEEGNTIPHREVDRNDVSIPEEYKNTDASKKKNYAEDNLKRIADRARGYSKYKPN